MDNHLYSILCCKYYAYDTISIWRRVAFLYKKRKRGLFFYFLLFRRIRFHISSKLIFFSRKKNADITNTHGFVVGINRHSNRHTSEEVQVAFKVLMTHGILQFALRIAFRCVLHRCGSQDIHCWKCWSLFCFYENSESYHIKVISMFWFVFIFQRNVKGFAIFKNIGKFVCVLCPRDMSFFTEVKNNISFFLLKDTNWKMW